MTIDTTKESICINQLIGQKSENAVIEGDMIVPDIKPDILNTIMTNGNICIYKEEVLDGKVRIDGTIQVYIIYLADDENGTVRSLNTSLDFTENVQIPNAMEGMNLIIQPKVNSIEAKVLNGRKINLKANVNFSIKVYSNENIEIINEINGIVNLQKLNHDVTINSLIGNGSTKAFAKETIAIDPVDYLAEILNTQIKIINKDIKISYNKVLVKADADINILYLTEDNRISSCQSIIPVMGFVDIPNISEEHTCNTNFILKNFLVKPNNEEDHSIYVEAELEISCYAFERKKIAIIEDLYSPSQNLSFTQKSVHLLENKNSNCDICQIEEKIPAQELIGNIICNVSVNPIISSQIFLNNKISFEGELQLDILFWNEKESRLDFKHSSVPFRFAMDIDGLNNKSEAIIETEIRKHVFVLMPDGNLSVKIDIAFIVDTSDFKDVSVIDEITANDNVIKESYSMIIYFVKRGDTLWKIAKKFGNTVEEIAKINEIENIDNIQEGMQLFIPRYFVKQLA